MSKVHRKKLKSTRKRVPVSAAEEERYFQNKLAKLKEEMEGLQELPTEMSAVKRKKKIKNQKEVTKVAKKKGKVKEVVQEVAVEVGVVTAKDLADVLGITPLLLRKRLRTAGMEKPEGGRWEWPEDHEDVDTILGWKDEVAAAPKAKAEPAAKKGRKKKAEPVVEEIEEEDEEEEEDDEEEEGIDLEAMTLKELRALCDEEGIEYKKKDKKPALIEALLEQE